MIERARGWFHETKWLAGEARGPASFTRLMHARLSLSRVGPFVAPRQRVICVDARNLGPRVMVRTHTSDISVFGELANGAYRHLPSMPNAKTIIDLGANTGLAARWLHRRYPQATLVCVEPDPGNADILRVNTTELPVTVIEACVGGHERTVSLASSTGEFGYRIDGGGTIPVLTMQQVLERAGMASGPLDIVKCDIEGSERELLETCSDWIARVRACVVECHAPYTAKDAMAAIARAGGRFNSVHTERDPAYGVETVTLLAT